MFTEHMQSYQAAPVSPGLRVDRKATSTDTRTQNRRFVLQRVYTDGPTSRADIARATGLTRATVSDLVADLLDDDLVLEVGTAPSAGGKPPTLLTVADDRHRLVTIRLGANRWTGSLLTLRRRIIRSTDVESAGRWGAPAIDALGEFAQSILDSTDEHVLGIGIATPGVVTPEGMVREATSLDWHGIEVGRLLTERFDIPTHVINDATALALAEYSLGEHDTDNLFVVKIGTGVGAGIILDGRPYLGEEFAAGEIGQLAVLSMPPGNGGADTLEHVTSARAFAEQLGIGDPESVDSRLVFHESARRAANGDRAVAHAIEIAGRYLGVILATVTGVLDLRRIVVAGPVTQLGTAFLDPAREEMLKRVGPAAQALTDITFGTVDRGEEHGAAMLVLSRELGIL